MVRCAENGAAQMRYCQAQEVYGSAVGGNYSHQNTGVADYQQACAFYVKPQVAGVLIAQKEQIKSLGK